MKNVKFLVVALIASMMLMGAGYATLGWTDQTNYQATIATGNLEVLIEGHQAGVPSATAAAGALTYTQGKLDADGKIVPTTPVTSANGVQVTPAKVLADKKSVEFNFSNAYPGAVMVTMFEVRNTGSIPAQLDTIDWNVVDGSLDASLTSEFMGNGHFTGVGITGFTTPEDLKNLVLEPGDHAMLILTATVKDSADVPEKADGQYTAQLHWKQVNQ